MCVTTLVQLHLLFSFSWTKVVTHLKAEFRRKTVILTRSGFMYVNMATPIHLKELYTLISTLAQKLVLTLP